MRFSKVLGLAVVLVALAVTLNALAFKTAEVTSSASFTVVTSGSAALAVTAADSDADPGIDTDETPGVFSLTINDQVQPNSKYLFKNVMKVANGTGRTSTIQSLDYDIDGLDVAEGTVKLYVAGTTTEFPGAPADPSYTLSNGESVTLDLEIDLTAVATFGNKPLTIVISGQE
ncbi:MAG TPA: hypothetical protein VD902_20905 [Symbiobacteriaceae bacterium]|nr:hypothetical protein [Symbiobacteriaceae bacterium]